MQERREPEIDTGRFRAWIPGEGEDFSGFIGPETLVTSVKGLHEVRVYQLPIGMLVFMAVRLKDRSISFTTVIDNPEDDKPSINTLDRATDKTYRAFIEAMEKRLEEQGQKPTLIKYVSGEK